MIETLPEKINERFPIMSQNGFEILDLVYRYNSLPQNSSERVAVFEKIQNLIEYEKYFE